MTEKIEFHISTPNPVFVCFCFLKTLAEKCTVYMTKFHCHREGKEKNFFSVFVLFVACFFLFKVHVFVFVIVPGRCFLLLFACVWVLFCLFICCCCYCGGGGGEGGCCEYVRGTFFFYALYILKLAYLLTRFKIYSSLIRGFELLLAIAYLPKYSPCPQHRPQPHSNILLPSLPAPPGKACSKRIKPLSEVNFKIAI